MNRAMRKRLQRLKAPVAGPELADRIYASQYQATLEILGREEPSALKAIRLCHSVHTASDEAFLAGLEILQPRLDCQSGCAWCCHVAVQVHILDAIGAAAPHASRELNYTLPTRQRDELKRIFQPCPLLVDGQCSVYAQRPVVCRSFQSRDVGVCRQRYEAQDPSIAVPMDIGVYGLTGLPQLATVKVFQELGIDNRPVVLGLAVAALTRDFEGMVGDWLDGGQAFDEVVVL